MTLPFLTAPLLVGALVAAPLLPADASPTPAPHVTAHSSLAAIQAAGAKATSRRIGSLHTAVDRVTASRRLSDADRSAALKVLNADLTAMTGLQHKIAADTSVSKARADYRSIKGYRVYAVAIPQVRIATAADGLASDRIPKLQKAATALAGRVAGRPDLQSKLDDMNKRIATAKSDADGLATAALAVTPAAYNADSSVLHHLRAKLHDALAAAKQAANDRRAIVTALR